MTKEAIINGKKITELSDMFFLYCEKKKEVKRLQEENEELKNKNNDLIEEIASGNIDIKILQEENEELKEKAPMKLIAKNNKYRSALEEIRKLINETCWDYTDISIIPVKEKMLEVINEVLNDRN